MNEQLPTPYQAGSGALLVRDSPDYWSSDEELGSSGSLSEIAAKLYRQRFVLLAFLALGLAAGGLVAVLMPRYYQALAVLQIEETPRLLEGQEKTSGKDLSKQLNAQPGIVTSRAMAERVAGSLKLEENSAFMKAFGPDGAEVGQGDRVAYAIAQLRSNVSAKVLWDSDAVEIAFKSRNPRISAQVANAYAEGLIASNFERRYETGNYARDFLAKKLAQAKARLEQSERAAVAYARNNQIVDMGGAGSMNGGGSPSLSAASLIQMNADLATARSARIQAEQRWRQAAGTPMMNLPEVQDSGTVQGLLARRAQLSAQLAKIRETFRDDYPDVIEIRSEIAQIDRDVSSFGAQVRSAIRERYETAARQEAAMAGRMGGLKAATLQEQDKRVNLNTINRDVATNRSLYDSLLQRYQAITTAAGLSENNMSIVERAEPGSVPTSPNVPLILGIAFAAGLGFGALAAFVREYVADSIKSPDDVFDTLGLPLLGVTPPTLAKGPVSAQLTDAHSPLSEAYHSVRCSIEFGTGEAPKSLFITSSRPGEGKSTTALALAVDFATHRLKILLIDADLRRPGLHKLVGGHNEAGLADLLTGKLSLDKVIQRFGDIDFVPSGRSAVSAAEILSSGRVAQFLARNRALYDVIVIDGPPVMGLADAPQIARSVEATILVVEASQTKREYIRSAIRRLRAANGNVVGVVLTKFDPRAAGYSARYGDLYSYGENPTRQARKLLGLAWRGAT